MRDACEYLMRAVLVIWHRIV